MSWITAQRATRLIAFVVTLVPWSPAALAQLERATQSVDIVTSVGFQQRVQLDKWNPVTVTVRNAGDALTGYVEVVTADSRDRIDYQTRYRQPLELAKGAQKRLQFTIYISRITEPLRIQVITAGGAVVATHSTGLRSKLSQQRFIVALTRNINLDYLNDRESRRAQVVYPLAGFLPDNWQGYDGVEAVILHRYALNSLTPRQYTALIQWISAGGVLLVSGGYDTALLRTPRIAQLLPARVIGTQQLSAETGLHGALGIAHQPLILNGSLGITSVDDSKRHTVHHINDVPLVLEHGYGRGTVVLLTFDLASNSFSDWSGMRQFMYRVMQLSAVKPITLADQQNRDAQIPLLNRLTRQHAIDYPAHATVIAFTAFYLVVLALFALRNTTGSNNASNLHGWKTALDYTVPIVFSVAAIALFHRLLFPQLPSLASVAVIEPFENSALARLQLQLGSHSTRTHSLGIRYTGANPMLRASAAQPLSTRPFTPEEEPTLPTWVFEHGVVPHARPLDAIAYKMFNAHGSDIIEFAVNGSYQADAVLEFHNTSGRTITDLWAFTRKQVFELGAVADDQTVNATLITGMPHGRHNWRDKLQLAHAGSRVPVAAVEAIIDGKFGAGFGHDHDASVLLVGFTSNPWTTHSEHWNHIDLTMMVWRIPQQAVQP